jgi:hypothetical protein
MNPNIRNQIAVDLLRARADNPISLVDPRYPGTMRDASQWMLPQADPRVRGIGQLATQPMAMDPVGGFLAVPTPTLETVFAPPEKRRR